MKITLNIMRPNNMGSVGKAISIPLTPVTSAKETDRGVQKNNRKNRFLKLKIDIKITAMKIGATSAK